ncbi:MAG: hypothetical protein Solivirus5_16 [Solivirus sp.]|uniref:Uncharacterized protein n=1 Tax=Solivirus sp. TaxID=2487772 RepID=A0A3G5AG40_9VIRU|nr:MAG: hypothetical protein Solivirus5_16 [Solivirus sp.]
MEMEQLYYLVKSNLKRLRDLCQSMHREFPEELIRVHSDRTLFTGNHSYSWQAKLREEWTLDDCLEISFYEKSDFYPELFRNELLTPHEKKIALRQFEKDKFACLNNLHEVGSDQPIVEKQIVKIEAQDRVLIRDLNNLLIDLFTTKRDRRSGLYLPSYLNSILELAFGFSYKMMKWYILNSEKDHIWSMETSVLSD